MIWTHLEVLRRKIAASALATFPHGAHDDAVDSTALALNDLPTRGRESTIITFYRRWAEEHVIAVPNLPPISAASLHRD